MTDYDYDPYNGDGAENHPVYPRPQDYRAKAINPAAALMLIGITSLALWAIIAWVTWTIAAWIA